MLGFSVDLPSALRFFCQSFFMASTASYIVSVASRPSNSYEGPTIMASEEPIVEVPIVFASS
jgi:hypothetical protein